MSGETRPVVAIPAVAFGQCDVCDRVTPQLYAWHYAEQPFPDCLCGWCVFKGRWIVDHASELASSWLAEEETP